MNEWIKWNGGECPVPTGTPVDVEFRDGQRLLNVEANTSLPGCARGAYGAFWMHHNVGSDIVAYRIVEQVKPAADGWIKWHGGECPVSAGTPVEVQFRFGVKTLTAHPHDMDWVCTGTGSDIVAYRIVDPAMPEIEFATYTLDASGYERLASVLHAAFNQAANGKGKERHARDAEPFHEQVILQGAKRFGHGALLFQAFKKSEESQRLSKDRAIAELHGAIVYLAAAVIALEDQQ